MADQKQGQENVHFQNLLLKDTTAKEMILSYKPVTLIHVQVKNLINLIGVGGAQFARTISPILPNSRKSSLFNPNCEGILNVA